MNHDLNAVYQCRHQADIMNACMLNLSQSNYWSIKHFSLHFIIPSCSKLRTVFSKWENLPIRFTFETETFLEFLKVVKSENYTRYIICLVCFLICLLRKKTENLVIYKVGPLRLSESTGRGVFHFSFHVPGTVNNQYSSRRLIWPIEWALLWRSMQGSIATYCFAVPWIISVCLPQNYHMQRGNEKTLHSLYEQLVGPRFS